LKKILLLSDTHGYIDKQIIKFVKQADEVWHAGDVGSIEVINSIKEHTPIRGVYGNIDGQKIRSVFPLNNRFLLEGVKVWITHIGGYPNRYDKRIREEIKTHTPDLFISGHSHILKVMPDKKINLLHMNPGAAGKNGFHKIRTMLRFELDKGKIQNLEVIELGKR
jgi:putative phosphoesterase